MSQTIALVSAIQALPSHIAKLLGKPALARGESQKQFNALVGAIGHGVNATGILVWSWAQDIAYYIWDVRRLRRIKAKVIESKQKVVIAKLLRQCQIEDEDEDRVYDYESAKDMAQEWLGGGPVAKDWERLMSKKGFSPNVVLQEAYALCSLQLHAIDEAIREHDLCRLHTLRAIAEYSKDLAKSFQSTEARYAEFTEVPTPLNAVEVANIAQVTFARAA